MEELVGLVGAGGCASTAYRRRTCPRSRSHGRAAGGEGNPRPAPPAEILKLLESVW